MSDPTDFLSDENNKLVRLPAPRELEDPEHLKNRISIRKGIDVHNTLIEELAIEAEYLAHKRETLEAADPRGDHSPVSQRRAVILSKISDIIQSREKMSSNIDLEHPVLRLVIQYFFGKLREVLEGMEGISGQQRDAIFQELGRAAKDYKEVLSQELEDLGINASAK